MAKREMNKAAKAGQPARFNFPSDGTFFDGLKYISTEIDADGISFATQALDRLLVGSRHEFHVNLKKKAVQLDDETFHSEDEEVLLVLQLYEEAAGNPLTFAWMQSQHPLLHETRIDRLVKHKKKIPKPIRDLIKTAKGKGTWLDLSRP
jgi:hypothetical protein